MEFGHYASDRRGSRHKLEHKWLHLNMWKNIFYCEHDRALAQVAQRCCGCYVPGDFQGQNGPDLEQPDVAVDVPVCCRGAEL